ncbi:FtsQ-type POTRA domain-containing protein [Salinisphaera sp. USBA-960]|uniref:cell division protein FtsQ/DivIB n=1 Tax=Salinisphaera orenii TaxID=856731 RepID=UPI0013A65E1B|nr:FtsQ-type POTRA domain-containing protein [Salifodinibacter halophilus]NNC26756.1 FtsQ-type POTRA domain-containing protein [Salifodinibacter halophilus]
MIRSDVKRMLDLALIAVLAGGAVVCIRQGVADDGPSAKRVYVRGVTAHVDDRRLARIARSYLQTSFFNIDTAALAHRLNQLAWLHNVTVTRRWPNGVLIHLNEYRAMARWNEHALLAANGNLFRPVKRARMDALPKLAGPEGSEDQVFKTYQRLAAIVGSQYGQLAGLRQTQRGSWRAVLGNGLRLRIGRQQIAARMQRFTNFADASARVRKHIAQAGYVDLRYADGFAVGGSRTSQTNMEQTG